MTTLAFTGTSAIAVASLIVASIALSQSSNAISASRATSNINVNGFGLEQTLFVNMIDTPTLPTPLPGTTNFYSTGPGNLTQVDPSGSIFVFGATSGDFLPRDGSLPMTGNLQMNNHGIFACADLSMTGNINLNGNEIINVTLVSTPSATSNILIGFGLTNTSTNNIVIGSNNQNGISAQQVFILGNTNHANANNNGIWGNGNTTNATDCYVVGTNTTNNHANSFLFGTNVNNVFTTNTSCDLGMQTNPWQNMWLSQNCFVGGLKVPVSVWATTSSGTITTGFGGSYLTGASLVGSLTYPPISVGCIITVKVAFFLTIPSDVSTNVLQFSLLWNGVNPFFGTPLALATSTSFNMVGTIEYNMTMLGNGHLLISSQVTLVNNTGAAFVNVVYPSQQISFVFDNTVTNILDLQYSISAGSSTFTFNQGFSSMQLFH